MAIMGLQRAPVQKFRGLDTVTPPYDLPPGKSPDLLNVRYPVGMADDQEVLVMRKGLSPKVTGFAGGAPVSTVPMDNGINCDFGNQQVVCNGDGDVWMGVPNDSVVNTLGRIFDGGAYVGAYTFAMHSGTGTRILYFAPMESAAIPAHQQYNGVGLASAWASGLSGTQIKSLVSWRGRLVATTLSTDRVQYTSVGSVTDLNANFIDIFDSQGSANIELVVHNNNLYLIKQNSVWMIYDPVTFANRLISTVGSGSFLRRISTSCPVDKRLYWYNQRTGLVYSTNGETDFVIENLNSPIPSGRSELDSFSMIAYDQVNQSILINWPTALSAVDCDRMDEIAVSYGSPGDHEIFRHSIRSKMILSSLPRQGAGSVRPGMIVSNNLNVAKLYDPFFLTGSDDGVSYASRWRSGWLPIISEEPWERIRRVSLAYRGTPTIDITSSMALQSLGTAVSQSIVLPAYAGDGTDGDRTFVTRKGPQKKGRYHMLGVRGSGVVGEDWGVSALELAIRGGKQER